MMAVISIEVVRSTLQLLVLWYTLYSCMLFVSCSVKLRSKLIAASVLPYKWVPEGDKPQFELPCMSPPPIPILRYHLTAPCSQQDGTYNVTITGADGVSVLRKQVEANSFTTSKCSETLTFLFDAPLPQGMLNVEVFKVITIPVKELNHEGIPVEIEDVAEWSSSSKATGKHIDTM